jgi:hypothetical protein
MRGGCRSCALLSQRVRELGQLRVELQHREATLARELATATERIALLERERDEKRV